MKTGLDVLLEDSAKISQLQLKRVGLVAHPASVDEKLNHTADLLQAKLGNSLTCLFGPQHGMRGDKQDNMIESEDYQDPQLEIPVFSLYGPVRRPTPEMLEHFDTLLFDLQDLGCRIYTFLTTLFYCMEDCARTGKSLWVLDRPNPAGRPVEGQKLESQFFSFVGGGELPMRHGLTLGEAARWYKHHRNLNLELVVIPLESYAPTKEPWPATRAWINPSPNAPNLNMVRTYPGSVMVEGTLYSEGRGTTRPLELFGAPHLEPNRLIQATLKILGPDHSQGFQLRPCHFEPTFHKFQGELCGGVHVHTDTKIYEEKHFRPYRLFAALFKAAHTLYPDFPIWSQPPYEYEYEKLPIDLISGSEFLRKWVEDRGSSLKDLDEYLMPDEKAWAEETRKFLLY